MLNPPETLTVEPPGHPAENPAGHGAVFTRGACLGRYAFGEVYARVTVEAAAWLEERRQP